jgi:hypothetical protein
MVTSTPKSNPLTRRRMCPPPPNQRRGGTHSPAVEGARGPNSVEGRKSLVLCLLCAMYKRNIKICQMSLTVQYTVYTEHIDSVKSLYAVTPTPYHECKQLVQKILLLDWIKVTLRGTVTFFIQTFFIRDKVYTNFLYTGQNLYGTKFIRDKVYTGTKFIRGQSLYEDKVYTGQSLYSDKVYTGTKFIQTFFILQIQWLR